MIRFSPARPILRLLLLTLTLAFTHAVPSVALAQNSKSSTQKKPSASKAKAPAKKAAPKKSSASKSPRPAKSASQCRTIKVKTAQGTRTRKVCGGGAGAAGAAAAAAPLASPITANALDKSPDSQPEFKARNTPDRAYAVDGTSFFHQGRKFRVQGLDNLPGDVATQRLQMALDSGAMTLEPVSVDDSGVTTAVVRVGGQNLADKLRPH
ncbi:MAG: hypothetical protein REI94_04035 [Moraxellaceae bacterium]|nr:hypothetical protein [Moraxellaceae bacterium]